MVVVGRFRIPNDGDSSSAAGFYFPLSADTYAVLTEKTIIKFVTEKGKTIEKEKAIIKNRVYYILLE